MGEIYRRAREGNKGLKKKLPDLIDDAEENRALMVPSAVRDSEKGYVVTGFTWGKMAHSIDIYKVVNKYIDGMADLRRAMRLVDYLQGKGLRYFPWDHRVKLQEDIKGLVHALSQGGYGAGE